MGGGREGRREGSGPRQVPSFVAGCSHSYFSGRWLGGREGGRKARKRERRRKEGRERGRAGGHKTYLFSCSTASSGLSR